MIVEYFVTENGHRLAYEHKGSGPALVLVHGGFVDRSSWAHMMPLLSAQFSVYALDRLGHGDSDAYPPDATLHTEARALADFVSSLSQPVYLVGHSSGARAALHAAQYKGNVHKLALYEPPAFQPLSAELKTQITVASAASDREQLAWLAITGVVGESTGEKYPLEQLKRSPLWDSLYRNALSVATEAAIYDRYQFNAAAFSSFSVPTLLLLGTRSKGGFMQASVEGLSDALPGSRIVELEGQGHSAMFRAPQLLADTLFAFWHSEA